MKALVIGSGGREHCLAWKLSCSSLVDKIYCCPGNGGTESVSKNIDIGAVEIKKLADFAIKEKIDLTVVGPELSLTEGVVDEFISRGLKIFGPTKELARLESSKVYAKEIMRKYGIPTADFEVFIDPRKAKDYAAKKGAPIVIKADGLAAGKGVVVASSIEEANSAIEDMLVKKIFGSAGEKIIIENCLIGQEVSILFISDGNIMKPLVSSQDHKRIFDGDTGPNTGGMGAYAPAPMVTSELAKKIEEKICRPMIAGFRRDNKNYKGILYAGLMIVDNEPMVLEFNARFGDPETQVILPKLKNDLTEVLLKTIDGKLDSIDFEWDDRFCLTVVLASGGYPCSYSINKIIEGINTVDNDDVFIFHAGTEFRDNKLVTAGGRVLNVTALGNTIETARMKAYQAIEKIKFEGMYYRKDIGHRALQ